MENHAWGVFMAKTSTHIPLVRTIKHGYHAQWGKKNDLVNNWPVFATLSKGFWQQEPGNVFERIEHCGGSIQD